MADMVPVTVTETVQARGETITRTRETVQDLSKLPRAYTLRGETQTQKVEALREYVAQNRVYHQLELLAYIEDILLAPVLLETFEVTDAG